MLGSLGRKRPRVVLEDVVETVKLLDDLRSSFGLQSLRSSFYTPYYLDQWIS
jgi:hypothetical protein